ncbi:MAG: RNA ligase [Euryarchaeota archaeon ADurb.BinA087]|nr:MAG: RNA ligase [Euryarchaeota archaeon ADurb.BinA087]
MIDISQIKYPHLDRLVNLRPAPQIVLGKLITWTVKEDGSNIGVYAGNDGELHYRSRNMDRASDQFYGYMNSTDEYTGLCEMVTDSLTQWNDEIVVFGELLTKGKSPTRIETHEKTRFVVFDIWSTRQNGWMNYTQIHQNCYHYGLPVVEMLGTCRCTDMDSLYAFKDDMLQECKSRGKEGTVAKIWDSSINLGENAGTGAGIIYFKEKLDTPKMEKAQRLIQEGAPQLPSLPDSEVWGAIEKARADLGEDFTNIKRAMPLIAQYVGEECKKHICSAPERKLISYYQERLQEVTV